MASSAISTLRAQEQLVRTLPIRLQTFFARYPPGTFPSTSTEVEQRATTQGSYGSAKFSFEGGPPSPFQPWKNPDTGRWRPPVFSIRRQAELVKLAESHGLEELLPYTSKKTEERLKKRVEKGLRVQGTGVGQKVKGKLWERTLGRRLAKRRMAMIKMPKMVQAWKRAGHGRSWKGWPR